MNTLVNFFSMGGYGIYIWPSYAVALILIGILTITSLKQLKTIEKKLDYDNLDKQQ